MKPVFRLPAYAGLFLITLSTLLYQMLLTRIYSVTMWYHFAFVSVSLAMFGLTAGAIIVHLLPGFFSDDMLEVQMARASFLYSVTMVFCLLTQLAIPFRVVGIVGLYSLAFTYLVGAVPFVCGGVAVCLALTRYPDQLSRLYAVDLLGAGFGCVLLIPLLHFLDGPTAIVAAAAVTGLGALCFALRSGGRWLKGASFAWSALCVGFVFWHVPRVRELRPALSIMYVKGRPDSPRLYEKWNAFSSVRVYKTAMDDNFKNEFFRQYGLRNPPEQHMMNIDAAGGTSIINFGGDWSRVEFLRRLAVNLAHYLRPDSHLLVIGTGGGIDVLGGLAFNQKKVTGVEINRAILDTVNVRFGEYSGHLDRDPRVAFVHDEGRSFVTRSGQDFDIILANVIDTWAAGASGAFALTENSLYTAEAWTEYLKHLTPRGIVTFTRWYFRPYPDEVYRLVGLGVESLRRIGVADPRGHIVVVAPLPLFEGEVWTTGTILVSPSPFSNADLDAIDRLAADIRFEVKLSPRTAVDATFETLAAGGDLSEFYRSFPFDIAPPTDDKPFFFHRFRFSDLPSLLTKRLPASADINMKGVVVLGALLLTVFALVFATVVFPLFLRARSFSFAENAPFLAYFASIGVAFLMIEIAQLQRLSLFLGHPTYSLSVVLFSLLIGSGIGSWASGALLRRGRIAGGVAPLAVLLAFVLAFGLGTPHLIARFTPAVIETRILVALAIMLPLGFFMGMPFPLGMKRVLENHSAPSAWFWGINGAASVCASVLAVAVSISWGIAATFWLGGFFYLIATLSLWAAVRNASPAPAPETRLTAEA